MDAAPVRDSPAGAVLTVHVQPNASKTEYAGLHGGALKFRVAAPPVEGAANGVLCAYLAKQFGIPKSRVMVQTGQASRQKRIRLGGVAASRVREALGLTQGGRV